MGLARDERSALSELFEEVGPDAPTLCGGWLTRDLAAHLVVRERRPDAAAGILIGPLAGYTERVQRGYAAKPWRELVELVRTGPPTLSPFSLPGVDEAANGTEFFVHHEDVRRGGPGWEPRQADTNRDEAVWRNVKKVARLNYRRSPVGVELRRPDGAAITAKRGPSTVTLTGEPGELLLHAFGRDAVRVEFEGEQRAIAVVNGLSRGI
ncbi:TIGR03085 family metal-binding protein [Allokutzneria sp. A3M-2-11 16]|uniref:TIGR03085 family metal-binding protein n=1 Tax=Allokutzneria sp. A3M-2-11 16 TaxID=2962043 RepID=UPI0020B72E5F|nr:TIGR03085 family metal-binding protein [Allokutzneria sp. A3M-2-11 16]MCP3797819.1 TIGR03085 family metal-binding protein [Allokutzneria sp. A3M-2-11 16]